ncbi:hypothetical protein KIH87_12770 [Paraneptunicella aestuarii]|uniref:hypothetical protein n=1 Tax=Paraneptunicella aestuarii TaxID=2831148 RepID=UPI001E2A2AAB|nr:hypothetical protein [Paraneptunicella aestuarii]UAA37582.1 hypothetical protein KIH87_12770 [Paraneptunicella aestuarii]
MEMQDLGFKAQSSVDFSQFAVLIIVLLILVGLSLFLRHRAAKGKSVLGNSRWSQKANNLRYKSYQIDRNTSLQEIVREDTLYVVLKTDSGVLLLDKIKQEAEMRHSDNGISEQNVINSQGKKVDE